MVYTIEIDLSHLHTRDQLFWEFSRIFSFPSYFGNNWDAFFDCMSSLHPDDTILKNIWYPVTVIHIILSGFSPFEAHFPSSDIDIFLWILDDLSTWEYPISLTYELL